MSAIVVVDGRTLRKAWKQVGELVVQGDMVRAYSGLTAMEKWLGYERRHGFKGRRKRLAGQWALVRLLKTATQAELGLTAGGGASSDGLQARRASSQ